MLDSLSFLQKGNLHSEHSGLFLGAGWLIDMHSNETIFTVYVGTTLRGCPLIKLYNARLLQGYRNELHYLPDMEFALY